MSLAITTDYNATGDSVYGVRLRDYSIDGEQGQSFAQVIAFASIRQSYSIEQATSAMSAVVKLRQQKVDDLAEVLATLAEALPSMPTDSSLSTDDRWSSISSDKIANANVLLAKYGLTQMSTNSNGQINYATGYKTQNDVQLKLDTEDNDLQQNMTSLQSLISKRDNAFSTANKIIQKGNTTARSTISAMGA